MPKLEYRFDLASILLASVLTVLGMSAAQAGEKPNAGISGGTGGRHNAEASGPATMGEKGGASGGDVRSRGGPASVGAQHGSSDRHEGARAPDRAAVSIEPNGAAWPPPPAGSAAWPPPPKDTFTQNGGKAGGVVLKK